MPYAAFLLTSILSFPAAVNPAVAEVSLHQRIDQFAEPGEMCSDAEFLRRIYLDLVGVIPSADEARHFLADTSSAKREQLIDRLLDDPRHVWHLVDTFDVMFMERRSGRHVPQDDWRQWLHEQFANNRPLDEVTRKILSTSGADPDKRPAAKFLLDRNMDLDVVTRDIGRIFLGRDLQCAQCHDHPIVPDYMQRHYYGLSAFLGRSYLFNDRKAKQSIIGEKAEGKTTFASVFTGEKGETAPRLLDLPELKDPPTEKDPYQVKPTSTTAGVPKHSRRQQLAAAVTDPRNTAFRENLANRIWAMLLGRGLVEPVDMWHSDNPPSHPELMALLADELHRNGYDLRTMVREIALSKSYQRSSQLPSDSLPSESLAVARLKPLTPEQFAWSVLTAVGAVDAAREKLKPGPADSREAELRKAMNSQMNAIVNLFASSSATVDFAATAEQALYLMNSPGMQTWLASRPGTLTARLQACDDTDALAEELYLSVFSRLPQPEEVELVAQYMTCDDEDESLRALQELTWAMLTSAEFRLNH